MASTDTALALTEQHRLAQASLRSRALVDFAVLWPLWQIADPQSFQQLVAAAIPLVRTYNQLSSSVAAAYFSSFRESEGVDGDLAAQLAAIPPDAQIAASLYATGANTVRDALKGGKTPQAIHQVAFVRTSGAVGRLALQGGRDTVLQSVAADDQARGWARVTDSSPCAFCLTLASRGAVYKSEQTADFEAHDHCACVAMPIYRGTKLPAATGRFRKIYDDAQRQAVESGELQPGENNANARINAVRRYLASAA